MLTLNTQTCNTIPIIPKISISPRRTFNWGYIVLSHPTLSTAHRGLFQSIKEKKELTMLPCQWTERCGRAEKDASEITAYLNENN